MKIHREVMSVLLTLVAMVLLTGCTTSPLSQAETFEQKAFALYGTYVIFQGRAAELVNDQATPEKAKQALREADKIAYPLAESLVDAAIEVSAVRERVSAGTTPEEKLTIALQNLSLIYFAVAPKLLAVVSAVKEAK